MSRRIVVVLPAPLGPRKPNTSLSSTYSQKQARCQEGHHSTPAGFEATPQLMHLALSDPSIRRKYHESAMSLVMDNGPTYEPECAWQEDHRPARTPTEQQVNTITGVGILSVSEGESPGRPPASPCQVK
jgi:hypothetical protein